MFDSADVYLLAMLLEINNKYRLYSDDLISIGEFGHVFCIATLFREIRRIMYTVKRFTRIHFLQDEQQGLEFLQAVEHIHPRDMAAFDETSTARNGKFKQSCGRSLRGTPAVAREWVISTKSYSIVVLLVYDGVADYLIREGTIDHLVIEEFLRNCVTKFAGNGMHFFCDNASVHLAPTTMALFDQVTQGLYATLPCYSPHLNPDERLFAMVWNWLQEHEAEALQNPLEWIHRAFHEFAVGTPRGTECRNLWGLYERNHECFLQRMEIEAEEEVAAMMA